MILSAMFQNFIRKIDSKLSLNSFSVLEQNTESQTQCIQVNSLLQSRQLSRSLVSWFSGLFSVATESFRSWFYKLFRVCSIWQHVGSTSEVKRAFKDQPLQQWAKDNKVDITKGHFSSKKGHPDRACMESTQGTRCSFLQHLMYPQVTTMIVHHQRLTWQKTESFLEENKMGWISGSAVKKHVLILQRTEVQSPAPTWWLTIVYNSTSRVSNAPFWLPWIPGPHMVQLHA